MRTQATHISVVCHHGILRAAYSLIPLICRYSTLQKLRTEKVSELTPPLAHTLTLPLPCTVTVLGLTDEDPEFTSDLAD